MTCDTDKVIWALERQVGVAGELGAFIPVVRRTPLRRLGVAVCAGARCTAGTVVLRH